MRTRCFGIANSVLSQQKSLDYFRDRRKLFRGGPPSPFQLDGHPPFDHEFRADGKYRVLPFVGREVLHEDYLDAKKQVTAVDAAFDVATILSAKLKTIFEGALAVEGEEEIALQVIAVTTRHLVEQLQLATGVLGDPNGVIAALSRTLSTNFDVANKVEGLGMARQWIEDATTSAVPRTSPRLGELTKADARLSNGVLRSLSSPFPLRGLVFSSKQQPLRRWPPRFAHQTEADWNDAFEAYCRQQTIEQPTKLETRLLQLGAVTVAPYPPVSPLTNLPHPTHSGLAVGGSSGGAAVAVRCGMSSFACGTNGAGSNRIPAGLLGISAVHLGREFFSPFSGFEGFIAPHVADIIFLCQQASLTHIPCDFAEQPPPQCKVLALDEFHGPSMDTETNCVPGTCDSVTPFSTLHPVVKKWFDGVRTALAGRLNLVHHSDFKEDHLSPPSLSDPSRPFLVKFLRESRGAAIAADLYPANPGEMEKLLLVPASHVKTKVSCGTLLPEHDDVLGPGGPNAEALRKNGIRFVLSPLLRVPYLTSIPSQQTDIGACVDPTFNPYCILANLWGTASITIPVPIASTVEGNSRDLPYGLLLTAVPLEPLFGREHQAEAERQAQFEQNVSNLFHIAHHIDTTMSPTTDHREFTKTLCNVEDDVRVANYPRWRAVP